MANRGTFGGGWGARALRPSLALACALVGVLSGMLGGALPVLAADEGAVSRAPKPVIAISTPGKCVEDTQFMIRNHMELLKHHRDRTVREGVRTTQHSLANCVTCHASTETGRVAGSKDAFCESCHRFAAVTLDCFECHTDKARGAVAEAASVPLAASAGVPQ
jgi:hypothetical protein